MKAARAAGANGWCLWNPACRYDVALNVLPALCVDPVVSQVAIQPMARPTIQPAIRATGSVARAADRSRAGLGNIVRSGSQGPALRPGISESPGEKSD